MKPRTRRTFAALLVVTWALAPLPPAAGAPVDKKKKKGDAATPTSTPAARKDDGTIQLPIPVGKSAANIHIPDHDLTGKLLSLLLAEKATRLDDDRVRFEGMNLDFNKPDGKQDFHIIMPASVMNLKTHLISSDDPVTVRTQDFELTGEKMEFNTVEREGRLSGNVRMVIHNLKQLAGTQDHPSE